MEFTEDQLELIREEIRKGANKRDIMMQAMTEPQKALFRFYSRGCDAYTLARWVEESGINIGIDPRSPAGIKFINESTKFFEALSKAIDVKINSRKQALKRRKGYHDDNVDNSDRDIDK